MAITVGLRGAIAAAVDSVWDALDNIPQTVILRRVTKTYNPSTGVWTDANKDYTLTNKGILTRFESFELDRVNILGIDRKLIIKQNDVTITPNTTTDRILIGSTIYSVVRIFEDPAGATFTLQLRMA